MFCGKFPRKFLWDPAAEFIQLQACPGWVFDRTLDAKEWGPNCVYNKWRERYRIRERKISKIETKWEDSAKRVRRARCPSSLVRNKSRHGLTCHHLSFRDRTSRELQADSVNNQLWYVLTWFLGFICCAQWSLLPRIWRVCRASRNLSTMLGRCVK